MTAGVRLLAPDAADDEAAVAELTRIVNGAYAVGEEGLWLEGTGRTTPGEIAGAIRSGGLLAATLEGRLVGCAYVRPLGAATAELGLVATATNQWGGGVGRRLVRSAEELMRSRGVTTMQLELLVPTEWNHPAKDRLHAWYTRLGYRVVRSGAVRAGGGAPRVPACHAVRVPHLPQATRRLRRRVAQPLTARRAGRGAGARRGRRRPARTRRRSAGRSSSSSGGPVSSAAATSRRSLLASAAPPTRSAGRSQRGVHLRAQLAQRAGSDAGQVRQLVRVGLEVVELVRVVLAADVLPAAAAEHDRRAS